jgi:hypothetical protein
MAVPSMTGGQERFLTYRCRGASTHKAYGFQEAGLPMGDTQGFRFMFIFWKE